MQNYGMVVAIRSLNTKVVQNYTVQKNVWAEQYRDENTGPFYWGRWGKTENQEKRGREAGEITDPEQSHSSKWICFVSYK